MSYKSDNQKMNVAWFLPRPKPDKYRGGMPLYCERWLLDLAMDLLNNYDPQILNLFCGMNQYGVRVDLNSKVNPHFLHDAHSISEVITNKKFDIILADPPYSDREAWELYPNVELPKLIYDVWTRECEKLLKPKGILIVYHKFVVANPNWARFEVVKRVFIGHRIYHQPRVAIYFQSKY